MSTGKWIIPTVLDPIDKVCVQIEVPNNTYHIAAFFGALQELGMAYNWEDSYQDGSTVAYLWRDIILQTAENVRNGEGCTGTGGGTNMITTAYAIDIGSVNLDYDDTTFVDIIPTIFSHTFTYAKALIICEIKGRNLGAAPITTFRLVCAGANGLNESRTRGTTQISTQINEVFDTIPLGAQDIKVQIKTSGGTDARVERDQNVAFSIIEYEEGGGGGGFDCDDVELCLVTSPTIINLTFDTNENTQAVEELFEEPQDTNTYPPPPTEASDPDELCGSAWYIAEALDTLCQDALVDAGSITLAEFLIALLGLGGFESSLLVIFWNFAFANLNPNLDTELTAAIPYVAEHFYCSELDPIAAQNAINADTNISADARTFISAGIDSITEAKLSLWVFVGSQDLSRDCSGFCDCLNIVSIGTFQMNDPPPTHITYVGGHEVPGSSGNCRGLYVGDEINFDDGTIHNFTSITIYSGEFSNTVTNDYQVLVDNVLIASGLFRNGGNCNFSKTNSIPLNVTGQEIKITRDGGTVGLIIERLNIYECL